MKHMTVKAENWILLEQQTSGSMASVHCPIENAVECRHKALNAFLWLRMKQSGLLVKQLGAGFKTTSNVFTCDLSVPCH